MGKNTIIKDLVQEVITESTKVKFGKYRFLLKVDTNEDPQKMGVRISFIPLEFGMMNSATQDDVAIELESRLERGLAKYGLRVERDRAVKDKSIIRFFIYIEYFERLVRKALKNQNPGEEEDEEDGAALPETPEVK
jgi:hypothetical protein